MALDLKNVFISDAVDKSCVDLLQQHGINVTCKFKLPKEELLREIKSYDGLIVRSDTKVTADVFEAAQSLKVVGRAGTGVDNIDLDAATKKGVIVVNTPGGNSISACELTCSLISCLARNVTQGCQSLKEGRWDRKLFTGSELYGKTLAIIGLGRIGREVALRMQSYGMKTIGFDPIVSPEESRKFNVENMKLDDIWLEADYITVHTPLIPQTRNLINDAVFTKCKKGVKVINVARGGIIDEEALLNALKDGRCGGAGLDVYTEEPPKNKITLELIQHPKVISTPHLGASTSEAQVRVAVEIAEEFVTLAGKATYPLTGVINAPTLSASMVEENSPWIKLVEKLGIVVGKLNKGDLKGSVIEVLTSGSKLSKMNFLKTSALVGVLGSRFGDQVNSVNAQTFSSEAGINVSYCFDTRCDEDKVSVAIALNGKREFIVEGTVKEGQSILLSINESSFKPNGVILSGNTHLVHVNKVDEFINDCLRKENMYEFVIGSERTPWAAYHTVRENGNFNLFC